LLASCRRLSLKAIPSSLDEISFAPGIIRSRQSHFPGRYAEPEKEGRSDHEEEVASNHRRPRDESCARLVVPAQPWKWKRLGLCPLRCRKSNGRSSYRFRALLPRAIFLSRFCGTFVVFELTWALVDSVNSSDGGSARRLSGMADYRHPRGYRPAERTASPRLRGNALALRRGHRRARRGSYRGQEKRSRSRAATPVISIGHADGRPGKGRAGLTCRA
jgi:hypothetical protein